MNDVTMKMVWVVEIVFCEINKLHQVNFLRKRNRKYQISCTTVTRRNVNEFFSMGNVNELSYLYILSTS